MTMTKHAATRLIQPPWTLIITSMSIRMHAMATTIKRLMRTIMALRRSKALHTATVTAMRMTNIPDTLTAMITLMAAPATDMPMHPHPARCNNSLHKKS